MRHRHKLAQAQRRRAAPRNTRFEADEASDEQPQPRSSRAQKRAVHQMHAEGGPAKRRLDKFRRGGRRTKSFDDGGVAAGSTRSPSDPGGELASANRGRKSTLDWIRDEILGGTKPAYRQGGRQRSKYDAGGLVGGISGALSALGSGPHRRRHRHRRPTTRTSSTSNKMLRYYSG
jgi:hypothetical protein